MSLYTLGLNHTTAPLDVRERVAFAPDTLSDALRDLIGARRDIGSAAMSMAAAAVKLAERIFPSLSDQRLLLIGAGEMIQLAATHFAAKKPKSITVSNRTMERGEKLADRFQAEAITLNEL